MRSGTGASVVNGRWAVDPPGEYQAGGTTFTYTRPRGQAEGEEQKGEALSAPGPTSTQLQLYVSGALSFTPPAHINQARQARLSDKNRVQPQKRVFTRLTHQNISGKQSRWPFRPCSVSGFWFWRWAAWLQLPKKLNNNKFILRLRSDERTGDVWGLAWRSCRLGEGRRSKHLRGTRPLGDHRRFGEASLGFPNNMEEKPRPEIDEM